LRLRCRVLTWQEIAAVLSRKLQAFLAQKYGIVGSKIQELASSLGQPGNAN
jgi:hypothetical protein